MTSSTATHALNMAKDILQSPAPMTTFETALSEIEAQSEDTATQGELIGSLCRLLVGIAGCHSLRNESQDMHARLVNSCPPRDWDGVREVEAILAVLRGRQCDPELAYGFWEVAAREALRSASDGERLSFLWCSTQLTYDLVLGERCDLADRVLEELERTPLTKEGAAEQTITGKARLNRLRALAMTSPASVWPALLNLEDHLAGQSDPEDAADLLTAALLEYLLVAIQSDPVKQIDEAVQRLVESWRLSGFSEQFLHRIYRLFVAAQDNHPPRPDTPALLQAILDAWQSVDRSSEEYWFSASPWQIAQNAVHASIGMDASTRHRQVLDRVLAIAQGFAESQPDPADWWQKFVTSLRRDFGNAPKLTAALERID